MSFYSALALAIGSWIRRVGRTMYSTTAPSILHHPLIFLTGSCQPVTDYMLSVSNLLRRLSPTRRPGSRHQEQVLDLNSEADGLHAGVFFRSITSRATFYRLRLLLWQLWPLGSGCMDLSWVIKLIWKDEVKEAEWERRFEPDVNMFYTLTSADLGNRCWHWERWLMSMRPRCRSQFLRITCLSPLARAEIQGDGPTRPLVKETLRYDFLRGWNPMAVLIPTGFFLASRPSYFTVLTFIGFSDKKKINLLGFRPKPFLVCWESSGLFSPPYFGLPPSIVRPSGIGNILLGFPDILILSKDFGQRPCPWVRKVFHSFPCIMAKMLRWAFGFWVGSLFSSEYYSTAVG